MDKEDYLKIKSSEGPEIDNAVRWQLEYARLFHRITDNSKMLAATGLKQEEFISLYDGLKMMIAAIPEGYVFPDNSVDGRMDAYLAAHNL